MTGKRRTKRGGKQQNLKTPDTKQNQRSISNKKGKSTIMAKRRTLGMQRRRREQQKRRLEMERRRVISVVDVGRSFMSEYLTVFLIISVLG
jgi:hypothetical protein